MDSQIHADHFTPNQSIEDSLKFLEAYGEVSNEDMGALNGDDVEGVDQLQGAAALVPSSTSSTTAAAVVRLFKSNASLSIHQKLYVCSLSVNMRLH